MKNTNIMNGWNETLISKDAFIMKKLVGNTLSLADDVSKKFKQAKTSLDNATKLEKAKKQEAYNEAKKAMVAESKKNYYQKILNAKENIPEKEKFSVPHLKALYPIYSVVSFTTSGNAHISTSQFIAMDELLPEKEKEAWGKDYDEIHDMIAKRTSAIVHDLSNIPSMKQAKLALQAFVKKYITFKNPDENYIVCTMDITTLERVFTDTKRTAPWLMKEATAKAFETAFVRVLYRIVSKSNYESWETQEKIRKEEQEAKEKAKQAKEQEATKEAKQATAKEATTKKPTAKQAKKPTAKKQEAKKEQVA